MPTQQDAQDKVVEQGMKHAKALTDHGDDGFAWSNNERYIIALAAEVQRLRKLVGRAS